MNLDPYWQNTHLTRTWGRWPDLNLVRFMLRQFGAAPDRSRVKCLDLGCGAGASALFLAQEGFDVLAVDGSDAAIKSLGAERTRRKLEGKSLATLVADLTVFDMHLGFDCVIDICTLQHLADSDAHQVITRAKSWMRSKGWFFSIMAAPNWNVAGSHRPRMVDRAWLAKAFDGYHLDLGNEDVTRPGGDRAAHWIVQAQKLK